MLLLLQWDHMSLADFAIFLLADICISRYCPERVSTFDLANPCVQYAGRAFTFQDAYKGTHIRCSRNMMQSQAMGIASLNCSMEWKTCCAGPSCFCWRSCAPQSLLPSSATRLRRPQLTSTT